MNELSPRRNGPAGAGKLAPGPWLAAILVVAVLLRLASAIYQGDVVTPLPGIFDQLSYDALARRVLAGHGFSFARPWWPLTAAGEPTAHWSFLYTLYLTAVYALFGPHPLAARLIQALIAGLLHPWLTWRIANRLFGAGVGLAAAASSAIYVYFFYYAGALMTETFYLLAILWTLDLATSLILRGRSQETTSATGWLLLGLALGAATLLRQAFLLVAPIVLLWIWRAGRAPLRRLALSVAVLAVLITPWTVRNYLAFDRFVLLNTNAGYAFFWANHPIHGASFMSILPAEGPSYQDLIPEPLRTLDEAALDQALLREGLRFVAEDPQRYLLLSLSRIKDYFKFWPAPDSSLLSNVSRTASFGLFLPFMLYGLLQAAAAIRPRRSPGSRAALALIVAFVLAYTAIHLLSWALIRYRLPVDALLILFAGIGVADLARWGRRRLARRQG